MLDEEKETLQEGGESSENLAEQKAQELADDILKVQKSEQLIKVD